MNESAFRITTVETVVLAGQLDCGLTPDALDDALDDAGYVRLDHGLVPGKSTAIMPIDKPAGRDPGHRAPAITLMLSLCGIVHADGPPSRERLMQCAEVAMALSWTDSVGEHVMRAVAAYALRNDPGCTTIDPGVAGRHGTEVLAGEVYRITRHANVVTDVAFARALSAGALIDGWENALWRVKPVEEPFVMVRRQDAGEYEALGVEPRLAELMAWVKANPDTNIERFTIYARLVGMTASDAANGINAAVKRLSLPQVETEKGTPSSTS